MSTPAAISDPTRMAATALPAAPMPTFIVMPTRATPPQHVPSFITFTGGTLAARRDDEAAPEWKTFSAQPPAVAARPDQPHCAPPEPYQWRVTTPAGRGDQSRGISKPIHFSRSQLRELLRPPRPPPAPQAVVRITFSAPSTAVVAQRIGTTAAPLPRPPPSPMLDADGLRSAVASILEATPIIDFDTRVKASRAGRIIDQEEVARAEKVHQAARLFLLMPIRCLARACDTTPAGVLSMAPQRVADHIVLRRLPKWTANYIRDVHNAWILLLLWLERHDVQHDGDINAVDLGDWLDELEAGALARGRERAERRREKVAALCVAGKHDEAAALERVRLYDGSSRRKGVEDKIDFLARCWGLAVNVSMARGRIKSTGHLRHPAPALSPFMLFSLAAFAVRPTTDPYHAAVALGMLFCAYAVMRSEQANSCVMHGVHDGFLHGAVVLDKHPNPDRRKPRPFWMRTRWPGCGEAGFRRLCAILEGVQSGRFIYRDFNSESGDPQHATAFLTSALTGPRLVRAKECTLVLACGLTPALARRYALLHVERHVLNEVASSREEEPTQALEVGRWAGSTAQDPDLEPVARLLQAHSLSAARMPEVYAPSRKVRRVCTILSDQMEALDDLHKRIPTPDLPTEGGFDLISKKNGPSTEGVPEPCRHAVHGARAFPPPTAHG